jgi:hypothetical protein
MKKGMTLSLLAGLLLIAISCFATGGKSETILHGYVTDAVTKKPVAGVTVSAITSKGTAGTVEVTTDAEGYFHFSQLPSVLVNLQFEKKGYQVCKRSGILVQEKNPLKINVEFAKEGCEQISDDSEYLILHLLEIN